MKVIDSMWFNNSQGSFGFVVGERDDGKRAMYGGVISGADQSVDEHMILEWGNKVNIDKMENLIAMVKSGR